jgi:hypothetical protein
VADFQGFTTIFEIDGTNTISTLGQWGSVTTSLYAIDRRGYVEYEFNVTTAGIYRIEMEGQDRLPFSGVQHYEMRITLDERYADRKYLYSENNASGILGFFTPWLTAGVHTVQYYWDNPRRGLSLMVKKIRLLKADGLDDDANGIEDWMEARIGRLSTISCFPSNSISSPAFIEGDDLYFDWLHASDNVDLHHGAGNSWYGNVSLNATGQTDCILSFQSGGKVVTGAIQWVAHNILNNQDVVVRAGDTLKLTALPPSATNGEVVVKIDDAQALETNVQGSVFYTFSSAGVYNVEGVYTNGSLSWTSQTITVTVRSASFAASPYCWTFISRPWLNEAISTNIAVEFGSTVNALEVGVPTGRQFDIAVKIPEEHYVVARVYPGGPIITNAVFRGFRVAAESAAQIRRVATCATGDQLIESQVVISPVLSNLNFEAQIISGGILFDDLSVFKSWNSDDFNELGEYKLHMIKPVETDTASCHIIDVFQGTNWISGYNDN